MTRMESYLSTGGKSVIKSMELLRTLFFFATCWTCFYLLFFIYDQTCFYLKANMPFTYVHHIFTLCFTCVCLKANTPSYLFKPVVRQLYSLAFHWEFYYSYSEPLDLRQYLAIGTPNLQHLLDWSAQSIPVCRLSSRCIMQIGKPETGKENSWTNSHRVQAVNWTSRVDNKVNLWQHPFNWAVSKNPQLFPCSQNHVWWGDSKNNWRLVWEGNLV